MSNVGRVILSGGFHVIYQHWLDNLGSVAQSVASLYFGYFCLSILLSCDLLVFLPLLFGVTRYQRRAKHVRANLVAVQIVLIRILWYIRDHNPVNNFHVFTSAFICLVSLYAFWNLVFLTWHFDFLLVLCVETTVEVTLLRKWWFLWESFTDGDVFNLIGCVTSYF